MKSSRISWDALLVVSVVVVAGICAQAAQLAYAEDKSQPQGRIVQIAPDAEEDAAADLPTDKEASEVAQPAYWIGIRGRGVESPVLRTQLQLAEDMGVVIEEVVPDSPADKAGLRKHDIILRANGEAVTGMNVLQDHVIEQGAKPIELTLIRLGKEEKLVVVPEERPEQVDASTERRWRNRWDGFDGRSDALRKLMEQMQRNGGLQAGGGIFGPGLLLHGGMPNLLGLPDGVRVSVSREGDGPMKIVVQRGDKTWEVDGDDPKSLQQLPDDVRPYVERLLQRQGLMDQLGGLDWETELGQVLPRGLGGARAADREAHEKELAERLERLEQQLLDLQKRLSADEELAPADTAQE